MSRILTEVIDKMLLVIPASETSLIAALRSCRSSAEYTAPEMMGLRWEKTATALIGHFGEVPKINEPWEREVVDIWMGVK